MMNHADPLALLYDRTVVLADRVARGEVNFLDAVDMAYSAACWAGLVERFGDDVVQTVLAFAFRGVRS
jgi:hypothetical protein